MQAAPSLDLGRLQTDLAKLVRLLHDDLRKRCDAIAEVDQELQADYAQARRAERTSESFAAWREVYLDQVAAAWVIASLFIRFLEDNAFLDEIWLAGQGPRRAEADERHSAFFQAHPELNDRDYFYFVFDQLALQPGCQGLFGREHTPLWKIGLTGDGAKKLREFWRQIDETTGRLTRDLTGVDTRFLGDLYQNLSEEARSRYALLQTPDFVESFILDRTLEPAIREFGLEEVNLLDPTCGSGHFLLGAFHRLLGHWQKKSLENPRALARKALEAVHGIDINPFAVAIARFRLLLAFLKACGLKKLKELPDIHPMVATGDSLLFARQVDRENNAWLTEWMPEPFAVGDYTEACKILRKRFQVVVGNPPYFTDKDKCHNEAVRRTYFTCSGKFHLSVPFTERFFDLADPTKGGFIGLITDDGFLKMRYGKPFLEDFLPKYDMTHLLDVSAAGVFGLGVHTLILFARRRSPKLPDVRVVRSMRGDAGTGESPGQGKVWQSIVRLTDSHPPISNDYIEVMNFERARLACHPCNLAGAAATEVKAVIENNGFPKLQEITGSKPGFLGITGADELFIESYHYFSRIAGGLELCRTVIMGDEIRDWKITPTYSIFFPYINREDEDTERLVDLHQFPGFYRWLWPYRTTLQNRTTFDGRTYAESNLPWWRWHQTSLHRLTSPLTITFSELETHNHFALDRGGRAFTQGSPIIKMLNNEDEHSHLAIVGILNSSITAFLLRESCKIKNFQGNKTLSVYDNAYQYSCTVVSNLPIPRDRKRAIPLATELDRLGRLLTTTLEQLRESPSKARISKLHLEYLEVFGLMISLQEELDWLCYELYGFIDNAPLHHSSPPLALGERAFEIALYRRGDVTSWFERHRSMPIKDVPSHWAQDYRETIERRLEVIERNPAVQFLEKPEYKRRWQSLPWEEQVQHALRDWLLTRVEDTLKGQTELISCGRLTDLVTQDGEFISVLSLYKGGDDYHPLSEVCSLVSAEGVPYLAVHRYTDSGLRTWADWLETWELQRKEDAGEKTQISVPGRYGPKDFQNDYWRLRGKMDAPKERFILYPGAERDADPSPVIGWAGWNHLQRALALANYFLARKDEDGWRRERLQPLLAGLAELIPWVKQWHNEVDLASGERLGDYCESFLREETRALGLTMETVGQLPPPPESAAKKGRKRKVDA